MNGLNLESIVWLIRKAIDGGATVDEVRSAVEIALQATKEGGK